MHQKQVLDWIEYIADHVYQYYRGRQVVLWGKYTVSDNIKNTLKKKYHIDTAFYVDGNSEKIDGKEVFSTDVLSGKALQYYVVIPLAVYQSIKDILFQGGYKADLDYFYFSDCILHEEENYYEDAHGNKLIGNRQGIKFAFSGFNSVVEIGDDVRFREANFYIHNNARIVIGDNVFIEDTNVYSFDNTQIIIGNNTEFLRVYLSVENCANIVLGENGYLNDSNIYLLNNAECEIGHRYSLKNFAISIGEDSKVAIGKRVKLIGTNEHRSYWSMLYKSRLEIGDRSLFKYGNLHLKENSLLKIGKEFTIEMNYSICSDRDTVISIGEDCMFSADVLIQSNAGHSIFDITTGKNLNSSYEVSKSRKVIIGNHVWVGTKVVILYNTQIKDGCVIGAMSSMVKCDIPNNCMAAGIPVRIIRRNVAWSREEGIEDISICRSEYVHLTEEKE